MIAFTTVYNVDTFELRDPLYVIGRAARVPYNKNEEKQQIIDHLISTFFGNDEPSMISHGAIPAKGFGLVCECEKDMSMGTYMMGIQVASLLLERLQASIVLDQSKTPALEAEVYGCPPEGSEDCEGTEYTSFVHAARLHRKNIHYQDQCPPALKDRCPCSTLMFFWIPDAYPQTVRLCTPCSPPLLDEIFNFVASSS